MSTHHFTLVLGVAALTPDLEDALFEAGCDDATLYETGGAVFLEVEREAPSPQEALLSALARVRCEAGVPVRCVLGSDLVNAAQIAERLGRTRESVRLLINGERGPGGFPPPVHRVGDRPLFSWGEVVEWLAAHRIEDVRPDEASAIIDAVNAALTLARAEERLTGPALRQVATLLGERLRGVLRGGTRSKRRTS